MIKAEKPMLKMEGSLISILEDFTNIVRGMNKMLHNEFGDKADDVMVLLGRCAVSEGEDERGYCEALMQLAMDLTTQSFKENENG